MTHKRICSLLFVLMLPSAQASRYASYDYDLTTPQFTPDGRLLQVEYATNACIREGSNPILSVGFPDGDDVVLVMGTISSSAALSIEHDGEDVQNSERNQRTQHRIIEVPISAAYNHLQDVTNPIWTITTSTILVGLSGHLSDANALLQTIYSQLEDEQSVFGWHRVGISPMGQDIQSSIHSSFQSTTTETALRLARAAADQCQKYAFGGGLRPLGASLLLSAVDMQQGTHGRLSMYNTDPSGGIQNLACSTMTDTLPRVMMSGGSYKSQSKLQTLIESRLKDLRHNDNLNTRTVLHASVLSLIDEWQSRQVPMTSSLISRLHQKIITKQSNVQNRVLPQLEVVFVSSKMGSFRLSDKDVSILLKDYR